MAKRKRPAPAFQPGDAVKHRTSGQRYRVVRVAHVTDDGEQTYEVVHEHGGGITRESHLELERDTEGGK
jgi:hypothetical protein